MNSALFFSFMTSLLICMALIPPLRLMAERFSIMDAPGERKVHQYPVPRVGGIAFAIGACASILWWCPKDSTTFSILLGGLIILGFGVWDDRANLGYRVKILGQLVAASAVIIIGSSPSRVGDFGLISYRVEHAGEDFEAQVLLVT